MAHVNQELRGKEGAMLSGAGDLQEDKTPGEQVRGAHLRKSKIKGVIRTGLST